MWWAALKTGEGVTQGFVMQQGRNISMSFNRTPSHPAARRDVPLAASPEAALRSPSPLIQSPGASPPCVSALPLAYASAVGGEAWANLSLRRALVTAEGTLSPVHMRRAVGALSF